VDYPIIPNEEYLDLVEREEQITFELGLDDDDLKYEDELDIFSFDNEYDMKEEEWKQIKAEILGEEDDDDESGGSDDDDESGSKPEKDENEIRGASDDVKKTVVIEDLTETDLVHLRRTIYLTIMSSATFEECTHKLAKMDIPPGRECELINMIIECCSQERTFLRYYGLVSGRFCLLHERWQTAFEVAFATQYNTIHRLETNKLRNVAKLFGHLLHSDSFSWSVLGCVHLNEDETTSSSRIFIKILVQEMAEAMGMVALKRRFDTDNPDPDSLSDDVPPVMALTLPNSSTGGNGRHRQQHQQQEAPILRDWFKGMFPKDNARNTRYAINFFTSIGLGPLTDGMREFLKNAPKLILAQAQAQQAMKDAKKMKENDNDDDASSVISTSSSDTSSVSSSSSGSSMSSSSSYTSSSSSSYSSYRRKKSRDKGGRDRKRNDKCSRSYSSYSSSSDDDDDDNDDGGGRKKHSSRDKRGGGQRRDRLDRKPSNDGAGSMASSRSVSESPVHNKSRGRSRRSHSSSRSHSPTNKRYGDDGDGRRKLSNDNDEGRKKRSKLSS
jgi:pre-mRNA-splicing factor CWC22